MRKLSKGLAIAATVFAIGGAGLVAVAQTTGPGYGPLGYMHGPGGYGMMGGRGSGGFADPAARLDALKTEFAIRPEQTAAWDGYAKAVQDSATQMQAIHASIDFAKLRTMSWQDHLAYMGQFHDRQAAAFKSVDAAATTLLAALDDAQKTHALLPGLENFGPGMMGWQGGSPMMGPGFGMMGPGYGMMSWGPGGGR